MAIKTPKQRRRDEVNRLKGLVKGYIERNGRTPFSYYLGIATDDSHRLTRKTVHKRSFSKMRRYFYWESDFPAAVKEVERYFVNYPNKDWETDGGTGGVKAPRRLYIFLKN